MPDLRMRYCRLHLYFAGGLSVLSLIAQGAPALAETSQPTAVSSERVITAEAMSAAASPAAPIAKVSAIAVPKAVPTTSSLMAQTAPVATPQNQTTMTAASEEQVSSVSQLSDVQPTDWAFQALQSLIERYGVVAGYSDGTYRGNRSLTRYEFAAGLNAALERVNELIAAGLADKVSRDDLVTLQRLQEDFAAELATLRGRLDSLEARTAELEANQFSTTTKLVGLLVVAATAGDFSGDRIVDATVAEIANEDPNATVIYRASLDLDTSFNGTDLLKLRLEAGSDRIGDHAAGFLEPTFGSALAYSIPGIDGQLVPTRLYYTFIPFKDFTVSLGPAIFGPDYVDRNSYANVDFVDFSTQAFNNNYLLFPTPAGAGAAIDWNPGEGPFSVRAVYIAGNAAEPNSNSQSFVGLVPQARLLFPGSGANRGLFGDPNVGIVELEYSPSKAFALRLLYSGGNVLAGRFDVFGANFELTLSHQVAVFGRYGYGSYADTAFGDINPNYWMAGVAFRDLFVPGALGGIAVGQPFIDNAVGSATQTNLEAFYNFPVSDNIGVTPLIQVITHPGNQNSNGTIVTGNLRIVFSF